MPLDTIEFTDITDYGGAYKCSQPGDMSGEYVMAEVARALRDTRPSNLSTSGPHTGGRINRGGK